MVGEGLKIGLDAIRRFGRSLVIVGWMMRLLLISHARKSDGLIDVADAAAANVSSACPLDCCQLTWANKAATANIDNRNVYLYGLIWWQPVAAAHIEIDICVCTLPIYLLRLKLMTVIYITLNSDGDIRYCFLMDCTGSAGRRVQYVTSMDR